MAGITSKGFENKTNNEILLSLLTRANSSEYFGEYFPTSPDSNMGILSGIITAAIKENWDGLGVVATQQNPETAEGKYLDDLAQIAGLKRLLDSGSIGELLFTGSLGTLIPQDTQVKSATTSKIVLTKTSLYLTQTGCNIAYIMFDVLPTAEYSIVADSIEYTYTSSSSPTVSEIIDGLILSIGTPDTFTASTAGDYLKLTSVALDNNIVIGTLANCSIYTAGMLVQAQAIDVGEITFSANTLTVMVNPVTQLTVTNPATFSLGRLEETDAELRMRMSLTPENTGTATSPAIKASIGNIEGVVDVMVVNNRTNTIDADGRPPKSFEVYVDGGLEQVIAQTILDTQPTGIESYGSITRFVTNENDDQEVIKFSRMINKFVWVKVVYSLNPEETFPLDGVDLMKAAIITKGNALYRGEDLVANKFYGSLYNSTEGMYISSIEVAVTDTATDTPTYTTAPISVARNNKLIFNLNRCDVTLL
ncbi:P2 gpJ-like protein [Shewanella sp. phage 1/40]|uniref:baseplate wedge subunit n=1 Tax=Shewanella sp. phage 1/40 TaxID=1458860 RepID=UPI0004F8A9EE|nr:baseplate wedge subunit [Shewanella sp. phage 1/40]AHK11577.1 P2 gpJ-like protein [Shewanella sp. phage 1/40]